MRVRVKMQRLKKPKMRDLNAETKALMGVSLRIEKLSGKVLLEKDCDLVMRNFVRALFWFWCGVYNYDNPTVVLKDTTGADRSGGCYEATARTSAKWVMQTINQGGVGDALTGVLVGKGTTAPTRTDTNLQDKLGTDKLTHNAMTTDQPTNNTWRLIREFTSATEQLNVTEAGLIYNLVWGAWLGGVAYKFLMLRDVFTAVPISIGNGIRVRYTFSY